MLLHGSVVRLGDGVGSFDLGDVLRGEVPPGGTAAARFSAVQGTLVSVKVRARQSSLNPTLAVKDGSGTPLDLAGALSVRGRTARLRSLRLPASGTYTLEIGAVSGSGSFEARTDGRLPWGLDLATLSGTVRNALTGDGIGGATVSIAPFEFVAEADGSYAALLPPGQYSVTFDESRFGSQTETIVLLSCVGTTLDASLVPIAPVLVSARVTGDAVPGADLAATATIDILDGSALESVAWTQSSGAPASFDPADASSTQLTLASRHAFKEHLIEILREPPIGEDELPPNVPPPEGEFPGGLQDRFQVVGTNPFSLEEAGHLGLNVSVTTSSGTYGAAVDVHATLPWKVAGGIRNVPIERAVLLHGTTQPDYNWVLTSPAGSTAALVDPDSQSPDFTPDVPGLYEALEVNSGTALEIYAGTWKGVIVGQDDDGRPIADIECLDCHEPGGLGIAPDKFTPWAQTGHAEIFTNNLNTSTHYGENCFACHLVGFDPDVENGGADDASDYSAFMVSGLLNNPGDNWTAVLDLFPEMARLANIQCENCHGPQEGGFVHTTNPADPQHTARVDLRADVCGACHGEPLRHARFQQWQLSAHANYELATEEGGNGNCARCHTANGFLTWLPILLDDDPTTDPTASITVTWTPEETHPQTCATCHDPHAIGTTTGINTNATVRISGNTPPLIAGFRALGVGRGAMCMTCHNSRRGERNDDTFGDYYGTAEAARAPHGSAQADVLMGENAYLVPVGIRGRHSFVTDTCVNCHMEQTPPPDLLSYNQGGTNHTFFASVTICSRCHGDAFDAEGVQTGIDAGLEELQSLQEEGLLALMADLIDLGNSIDLDGELVTNAATIADIEFGEARGRQSMVVTFTNGTVVGPVRLTDADVLDPAGVVLGQLYDFADPRLIKAGWNWNLIHNDGSRGIHNPTFAFQVLDAGVEALIDLSVE